jgi:hypothetical protein
MQRVFRQHRRRELERENGIVLAMVQSLVGAITPNVLRINVEFVGRDAHVHFVLSEDLPADRQEFEDELPSQVGALLQPDFYDCAVIPVIHVDPNNDPTAWPPGRPIFGARGA